VDLQLTPDEAEPPALRDIAWRILTDTAAHVCVSLEAADVRLRRAEGVPVVHITAAADELLKRMSWTTRAPS
jgi:hypothetical protein